MSVDGAEDSVFREDLDIDSFFLPGGILDPSENQDDNVDQLGPIHEMATEIVPGRTFSTTATPLNSPVPANRTPLAGLLQPALTTTASPNPWADNEDNDKPTDESIILGRASIIRNASAATNTATTGSMSSSFCESPHLRDETVQERTMNLTASSLTSSWFQAANNSITSTSGEQPHNLNSLLPPFVDHDSSGQVSPNQRRFPIKEQPLGPPGLLAPPPGMVPPPPPGFESASPVVSQPQLSGIERNHTQDSWFSTKSTDEDDHGENVAEKNGTKKLLGGNGSDKLETLEQGQSKIPALPTTSKKDGESTWKMKVSNHSKRIGTSAPPVQVLSSKASEIVEPTRLILIDSNESKETINKSDKHDLPQKDESYPSNNRKLEAGDSDTSANEIRQKKPPKEATKPLIPDQHHSPQKQEHTSDSSSQSASSTNGETPSNGDRILVEDNCNDAKSETISLKQHNQTETPSDREKGDSIVKRPLALTLSDFFSSLFHCMVAPFSRIFQFLSDLHKSVLEPSLRQTFFIGRSIFVGVVRYGIVAVLAAENISLLALEESRLVYYASNLMKNQPSTRHRPSGTTAHHLTSLCYATMYGTPVVSDLIMRYIDCPHYTPHIISSLVLYHLSRRMSQGVRRITELNTPTRRGAVRSNNNGNGTATRSYDSRHNNNAFAETDRRRLEAFVSQEFPRALRWAIPLNALLEGFSETDASFMQMDSSARLITAFSLALIPGGLLLSPVAWISWSVQVLLSSYILNEGYVTDIVLIFIGVASVGLIRSLETT